MKQQAGVQPEDTLVSTKRRRHEESFHHRTLFTRGHQPTSATGDEDIVGPRSRIKKNNEKTILADRPRLRALQKRNMN